LLSVASVDSRIANFDQSPVAPQLRFRITPEDKSSLVAPALKSKVGCFSAVQTVGHGASRHFAALQNLVAIGAWRTVPRLRYMLPVE
jgi:hypothetical protein